MALRAGRVSGRRRKQVTTIQIITDYISVLCNEGCKLMAALFPTRSSGDRHIQYENEPHPDRNFVAQVNAELEVISEQLQYRPSQIYTMAINTQMSASENMSMVCGDPSLSASLESSEDSEHVIPPPKDCNALRDAIHEYMRVISEDGHALCFTKHIVNLFRDSQSANSFLADYSKVLNEGRWLHPRRRRDRSVNHFMRALFVTGDSAFLISRMSNYGNRHRLAIMGMVERLLDHARVHYEDIVKEHGGWYCLVGTTGTIDLSKSNYIKELSNYRRGVDQRVE